MRDQDEVLWQDIMPLEWTPQKHATGFAHLDEQHQQLFLGLNSLITFLRSSSAADERGNNRKLIELLRFLGEYAAKHFQDEEAVFAQCSHPLAAANKEAHRMFIEKYMQYQQKFSQGVVTRSLLIQTHIFLQSWLLNHIVSIDTALRVCAKDAAAPSEVTEENRGVFSRFLEQLRKKMPSV